MKLRAFFFVLGIFFITAACVAPVWERKWSRYEPVGLSGRGYPKSTKMTLVYYDDRQDQMMIKYPAFILGGLIVYFALRPYGRPDYRALRRWAHLERRRRR